MNFKSKKEEIMFLNDEPFCVDKDSFSLGDSFEDAAKIVRELMRLHEEEAED